MQCGLKRESEHGIAVQAEAEATRRTEMMGLLGRAWLGAEVAGLEDAMATARVAALYVVLDTDALVHGQRLVRALLAKARYIVVLCAGVVAAIDRLKKGTEVANHRARDAARMLDSRLAKADPWLLVTDADDPMSCAAELARAHGPRAVVLATRTPDEYRDVLADSGIRALTLETVLDAA